MKRFKRLLMVVGMTAAIAAAYLAGTRNSASREEASVPQDDGILKVPAAKPADITVANPTAVLLGEVKVPDSLLSPPPPPERPDLIVPIIPK